MREIRIVSNKACSDGEPRIMTGYVGNYPGWPEAVPRLRT